MQKAIKNAATCELMAMLPKFKTLFRKTKLWATKKIKMLSAVLLPPQAAYR
jgi:hypothetical protein